MNRLTKVSTVSDVKVRSVSATNSFFADSPTESPISATFALTASRLT